MRNVALSVLLIGNIFANQVHAEEVSPQPLTRLTAIRPAWPGMTMPMSVEQRL